MIRLSIQKLITKKELMLKNKKYQDSSAFEEKQYTDIWNNDEYLQFMYERIMLFRELSTETGVFIVHCDFTKGHYLR